MSLYSWDVHEPLFASNEWACKLLSTSSTEGKLAGLLLVENSLHEIMIGGWVG